MAEQEKQKKVIINFGCGTTTMEGALNVDIAKLPNVDITFDFEKFPYPFEDNSVDEIHMYYVLEHLFNHFRVIEELHRILKPGGILYIRVPHGSGCYGSWGEITHYRGYCYGSFDIFGPKSDREYYTKAKFKILYKRCKYFLTYPYDFYKFNTWYPHWEKFWYAPLIKLFVNTVQFFVDLSPAIFERFWCFWVGGAAEVYVEMQKV